MTSGKPKPIIIVQGAQWGSEAKGMVAAALARDKRVDLAVRTGAVNAGHTVYFGGQQIKMQQLPTAWAANPRSRLILGAGTFVNPEILAREIEILSHLTGADIRQRVVIDKQASLHLQEHQDQAKLENRHHAIGATGKGCSVAITDKIRYRGKGYMLFHEWWSKFAQHDRYLGGIEFDDTVRILHDGYDKGMQISLEGTQGSLLDLNLGPYPYTTHKPTQAIEWALEAGLALGMSYEVVMVARTYPIRVAGNSGPMAKETTWPNIARTINRLLMLRRQPQRVKSWAIEEFEKALYEISNSTRWMGKLPRHNDGGVNFDFHKWTPEERLEFRVAVSEIHAEVLNSIGLRALEELENLFELTTVTKKLRRVAEWSGPEVAWSCRVNRGTYLVLTFFNYWHPETWGSQGLVWCPAYERSCYTVEKDAGIPVRYVTTGPESQHMIRVDKLRADWRVDTGMVPTALAQQAGGL